MTADRAHDMAQQESHLGPVRGLARPQDDGHRLAAAGLVDVDRQEAAMVVVGVEQRQLLVPMDAVQSIVDVEHDAARHLLEAVAEQLDHGRHHPLERGRRSGRFSSRHMVGCEHSSAPLSGSRPTASLNAGSARRASQSLASA